MTRKKNEILRIQPYDMAFTPGMRGWELKRENGWKYQWASKVKFPYFKRSDIKHIKELTQGMQHPQRNLDFNHLDYSEGTDQTRAKCGSRKLF